MFYRILTKNGIENTNIDGARDHNFNAGRRSGIVKGALNQGNFYVSSSGSDAGHTVILDTCELRLCGHRVVIDEATYWSFRDLPLIPQRYSLVAQVIVDNSENVTFDLFLQSVDTPLIQDNLDKTGTGTYQLEIGRYTQQTDGTITDVVRTADLITGGISDYNGGAINIGNVTTNTLESGMEAEVDVEERFEPEDKKTYTDFTFSIPKGDQGIQGIQGEKGETGATGNGIISISKTGTSKLVDTYTISFTSGATTTFQVTNGKGITKIEKTATSGLVDTYTITFNDTTTNTFQVTNGAKGDKGDKGDTGVTPNITATATTLPAGSSATVTKSGTAENPAFAFGIPKGDKGDTGASAGFGTPTATIDSNVGTPSVTITASGSDTSKVFNFAFKNIKGEKGDKGDTGATGATPNISVSATTLSAGSAATATISGSAESPTITFGIPKGDKGDSGTVVSVAGEEKTSINTDITPIASSENLITSGGVHDYPAVTFAESERQKSKNLLNPKLLIQGATVFANGNFSDDTTYVTTSQKINVEPNSQIVVSANIGIDADAGFVFFNNGSYVGYAKGVVSTIVPSNANQVVLNFHATGITPQSITTPQLEYGSVATDYQSYNGAIVHEKDIADVEHIETIYNIRTKNVLNGVAYTNGIPIGTNIVSNEFAGYKKFIIISSRNADIVTTELNIFNDYANVSGNTVLDQSGDYLVIHSFAFNKSDNSFTFSQGGYMYVNDGASTFTKETADSNNLIVEILGVK